MYIRFSIYKNRKSTEHSPLTTHHSPLTTLYKMLTEWLAAG